MLKCFKLRQPRQEGKPDWPPKGLSIVGLGDSSLHCMLSARSYHTTCHCL